MANLTPEGGAAKDNFGARMAARKKQADKPTVATAQGVGESQRFGGNYERTLEPGEHDWTKATLNGVPVPENLYGLLPWHATDQAFAELERNNQSSGVKVTRGPEEKMIDRFGDGLRAEIEPWEGGIDPLLEVKNAHGEPGKRYRFLSESKINRDGWRGWKPVEMLEKGIKKTVKLGNMIFGWMPEDRAQARDRFMADKARSQMVQKQDEVRELTEQYISATTLNRFNRRHGEADANTGVQTVHGDEREMDDRDFVTD